MYFNKCFDEMRALKERKVELTNARIKKLMEIAGKLMKMFKLKYPIEAKEVSLQDMDEDPNLVIDVTEEEVLGRKIIRDEVRIEVDATIKQFRTDELDKMMDGVLELTWEDKIRKDIAPPECITKDSNKYSAQEILEVRAYQEQVKALEKERQTYRIYLEAEGLKYQSGYI